MRVLSHRQMAILSVLAALATPACTSPGVSLPPTSIPTSGVRDELMELPSAARPIVVAVYNFGDQTGQFKPSDNVTTYSRAVTQGASAVLIQALLEAGRGRWFTVIERERLNDVTTERQIIREQRQQFAGPDGQRLPPPNPLLYAGVILQGGVIGYDSNTLTGGLGARYLGIGGSAQYRQDTVTVYLRAVNSQTGQVLHSVSTTKTIISTGLSADIFRFIGFRDLLEVEAGVTTNEPGLFALKQAIEEAVLALIVEGAQRNLWGFADGATGTAAMERYFAEHAERRRPGTALAGRPANPAPRTASAPAGSGAGPTPAPAPAAPRAAPLQTNTGPDAAPVPLTALTLLSPAPDGHPAGGDRASADAASAVPVAGS